MLFLLAKIAKEKLPPVEDVPEPGIEYLDDILDSYIAEKKAEAKHLKAIQDRMEG